ncbi:hypothetical protein TNCV_4505571 [Trichonephila clavipes]|nr:hypothetical protein TNCV_4505571 [Trichonephila clavipes]
MTIVIKFGLRASFAELESAKNAVNEASRQDCVGGSGKGGNRSEQDRGYMVHDPKPLSQKIRLTPESFEESMNVCNGHVSRSQKMDNIPYLTLDGRFNYLKHFKDAQQSFPDCYRAGNGSIPKLASKFCTARDSTLEILKNSQRSTPVRPIVQEKNARVCQSVRRAYRDGLELAEEWWRAHVAAALSTEVQAASRRETKFVRVVTTSQTHQLFENAP